VDKGTAVERIAAWYNAPLDRVAVIGDGHVDVPMFLLKGVKSIAMGNAPRDVQQFADHVTNSNEADGFACAVEKFILA
jgi:hydroxymethylpyrimidine pyrophosphatase-like HAD family hydrolase